MRSIDRDMRWTQDKLGYCGRWFWRRRDGKEKGSEEKAKVVRYRMMTLAPS